MKRSRTRSVSALVVAACLPVLVTLSLTLTAPRPASAEDVTDFDALLATGESEFATNKEEPIIRHFFRDRRDGFFVDIGCFDWKVMSTTLYFEKVLGWSGIGVDAQEAFSLGWLENRPRSKFLAYAITDKSGERVTFYQAGGISSTEKWNIEQWQKLHDFDPGVIDVPTLTMNDLLKDRKVEKIDFLSMDINGGEPTALKGFDIQRFRPDLVMIEVHQRNQKPISEYFEKNGYERIDAYLEYDAVNWYYKPRS